VFRRQDALCEIILEREVPGSPEWGEPDRWVRVHPRVVLTEDLTRAWALADEDLARAAATLE
jgi:hypothetical protein